MWHRHVRVYRDCPMSIDLVIICEYVLFELWQCLLTLSLAVSVYCMNSGKGYLPCHWMWVCTVLYELWQCLFTLSLAVSVYCMNCGNVYLPCHWMWVCTVWTVAMSIYLVIGCECVLYELWQGLFTLSLDVSMYCMNCGQVGTATAVCLACFSLPWGVRLKKLINK